MVRTFFALRFRKSFFLILYLLNLWRHQILCKKRFEAKVKIGALTFGNAEAVAQRCSVKNVFLEIFLKLAGKHQCQRLFFNKVAGLSKLTIKTPKLRQWRHFGVFIVNFERPVTLLTKSLWRMCFPVNFAKFLRTPFFTDQLRWMFLKMRSLLLTYYQFSIPSSSY